MREIGNLNMKSALAVCLLTLLNTLFIACGNVKERQNETVENPLSTAQKLNRIGITIPDQINRYDLHGRKQGLWIDDDAPFIIMTPYVNGAVDGCEMVFNSKPEPIRLRLMITYEKDELKSVIFFDHGMVSCIIDSIRPNHEYPEHYNDFKYSGNNKSYKDGRLEMSGLILLGEEWERDCEYIGQWKIYNDDGSITLKHFDPFK